jgi:DHA2 family multidrug resistance protein
MSKIDEDGRQLTQSSGPEPAIDSRRGQIASLPIGPPGAQSAGGASSPDLPGVVLPGPKTNSQDNGGAPQPSEWAPQVNPWIIAASVMTATFMVVLDSSVANVALPHIAGNLSATTDESTWVLTSYLVSNAIMLPAAAWISQRMGRKRLLMSSIIVFTGASLLCGVAPNLPMLIIARVLQGIGGGGMQPLAQSILMESFPPEELGVAMAVYGVGIVVAPIIGPTLGGWITDSYSWRWIFYINLPVGAVSLLLVRMFIEDPPYIRRRRSGRIDYLGFGLMALWLGALQLVLDKGQEADWFSADWIRWLAVIAAIALIGFLWRELSIRAPIVHLPVLKDRNFALGTTITTVYGLILYGVTAMLPLFLQTLLGYPALDSGLAVSPRGIGSLASMVVAGFLVDYVDRRILLACGFGILGASAVMLSRLNLEISMSSIVLANIVNGFATGFIFVPLTTMTMGRLPKEEMANAAGIYNLMRNIGGSVGIAAITTSLVRGTQRHQAYLVHNVSSGNPALVQLLHGLQNKLILGGVDAYTAHRKALGMIFGMVQQQASLLAYMDNFRSLGYLSLLCIPLALLFRRVGKEVDAGHAAIEG